MNYTQFSRYFENEESLKQLLLDCQDIFTALEDLTQQLQQNIISSGQEWKDTLAVATGHYAFLTPIYTVAVAIKENEEIRRYIEEKNELEAKGEKAVATHLDKSASLKVAEYRRVRNVLESYVNVAEKIIATAQSQLKRIETEIKTNQ